MPFLTDEQRKEPLERYINGFTFKTKVDFSGGVEVESNTYVKATVNRYSQALASFICFWTREYMPLLNGFSGLDTIKFNTTFEIV